MKISMHTLHVHNVEVEVIKSGKTWRVLAYIWYPGGYAYLVSNTASRVDMANRHVVCFDSSGAHACERSKNAECEREGLLVKHAL